MRFAAADPRQLGVVVYKQAADQYYNPATTLWESPFVAANHITPLVSSAKAATDPGASVVGAELGNAPSVPGVFVVIGVITGSGATLAWVSSVDISQGPPTELPVRSTWANG